MRVALRFFRFAFLLIAWMLLSPLSASSEQPDEVPLKPVLAWAAGPFEARVTFNREVDAEIAKAVVGSKITFEEKNEGKGAPDNHRGTLQVTAARLTDLGKTLVMVTDPHPRSGDYSLSLRGVKPAGSGSTADLVVCYTLQGIETSWESDDPQAPESVKGWLAGLDSIVTMKLSKTPGKLSFATLLSLPPGQFAVCLKSNRPVEATLGGEEPLENVAAKVGSDGFVRFQVESNGESSFFSAVVPTGPGFRPLSIELALRKGDAPAAFQRLSPAQTTLPWVPSGHAESQALINPPNLEGGDPALGKTVYQGAAGKCSVCHKIRGEGGLVGPDLSGLVGRDRLDVYRDIADPSSRIHPDYVSYTIARKDGTVVVGTVRSLGADSVIVTNSEAKSTTIARDSVEEYRPSATSIMPVGLIGALGEKNVRDLIAYLVSEPAAR